MVPIGSSPLKLKDTTIMGLPRQLTMSPNCNSEVFMLFLPGYFAGRNIVFIRRCYLFCTLLRFDRINSTDCYYTIFVFVQIQQTFFLLWSEEKIKTESTFARLTGSVISLSGEIFLFILASSSSVAMSSVFFISVYFINVYQI